MAVQSARHMTHPKDGGRREIRKNVLHERDWYKGSERSDTRERNLVIRESLLTNDGTKTVGADENVDLVGGSVCEVQANGSACKLFVLDELLLELKCVGR